MTKPVYPRQIKSYNIMAELGHGSFATVCKAFNRQNRRMFAMKIFPKSNLHGETEVERFQREVNSSAYLRHDNIVVMHDFMWDDQNFYLVLDYCPGGELFDYIIKHDRLNERDAGIILKQIADAVAVCHGQGIAHRDLKPENVLIEKWPRVKVSDFGLCGYIRAETMMQTFCGSPLYCAPECLARVQYDGRMSDVWSLGIILYAMVTGDTPWKHGNMTQMMNQIMTGNYAIPEYVSDECSELIRNMMQVTPSARYTIREVLDHPFLSEREILIPPPTRGHMRAASLGPPILGNREMSMEDLANMSREKSSQQSHGICSPFENIEEVDEVNIYERPKGAGLPRLCIRSDSVEALGPVDNIGRSRMVNRRMLMTAANRQRSVALLVPKYNVVASPRTVLPPMREISE